MDVASRKKLDDVLLRTKFSSLRWTTDSRGIFYATYAGALENHLTEKDKNNVIIIYVYRYIHRQGYL